MNQADSGAIEERLARLEPGVRCGKRATTATMVLLVLLIAWSVAARSGKARAADSGAKDLLARSLTIVDAKGNLGVALVVTKDGPRLALVDEKGRPRISLGVYKNGPSVSLSDEKGNQRVSLMVTKDGPGVGLSDENENLRVTIGVGKDRPGVVLVDPEGTPARLSAGHQRWLQRGPQRREGKLARGAREYAT